mgnify:FL=1
MAYIGKQPKKLGAGDDLPSQAGQSGKFLKSDGTNYSWADSDGSPSIVDNGNATAITIDSSENVGIGQSSPSTPLHARFGEGKELRLENSSTGISSSNYWGLGLYEGATRIGTMDVVRDGTSNQMRIGTTTSGQSLRFTTGASVEAMRIDSSGKVGIGNSSPATKLDISGTAGITSFTGTTKLGVVSRGSTGATDYSGYDFIGNSQANPVARIGVITTGGGSKLSFGTSNAYASGITNTAMTIDQVGNVGIGQSSPSSDNGTTTFLHIGGSGKAAAGLVLEDDENQWEILSNGSLQVLDGTSARLTIDSSGRVTMPNQPSFKVRHNYSSHFMTSAVLSFTVEDFDNGNNFNTSTSRFVAPVAGYYQFHYHSLMNSPTVNSGYGYLKFLKNGGTLYPYAHSDYNGTTSYIDLGISDIIYLSANDYVEVYQYSAGLGVYSGASYNSFTGHLIG